MSFPVPVTSTGDFKAVAAAAVTFDPTLAVGELWILTASTNCYIAQGAAPTASAADGSTYVHAGQQVLIDGDLGAKVSIIRVTADGVATLTKAKMVR